MKSSDHLSSLIGAFFANRLIAQKGVSHHTLSSYSHTFQLLLKYVAKQLKKRASELKLHHINAEMISNFLDYLEEKRGLTPQSRNVRLAAIHSFFNYLLYAHPEDGALIGEVLAIPQKRTSQKIVDFLTEEELTALLDAPEKTYWLGHRDHTFLVVAVYTGLRLSELTSLRWKDISLDSKACIRCTGKGRKKRLTPLTKETVKLLKSWAKRVKSSPLNFVFPASRGNQMSSDSAQYLVKKYTKIASLKCPSLLIKKVSPHVLRHTTAMLLLQAGTDLSSIAMILGHESPKTTYIYLKANLKMKEEILKSLSPMNTQATRFKYDEKIMVFLKEFTGQSTNKKQAPEKGENEK